jgi:hypothetical protein
MKVPSRIRIEKLLNGRYQAGTKPVSWDERIQGVDICIDSEGSEIHLQSSGDQSTPAPGWELLLTDVNDKGEFSWTLYGVSRNL